MAVAMSPTEHIGPRHHCGKLRRSITGGELMPQRRAAQISPRLRSWQVRVVYNPTLAEPTLSTIPAFIEPAAPTLRGSPPIGPSWRHEVKFDGWRVQVWKRGNVVELLSRRGLDMSHRAPAIVRAVAAIGTREFVIDAELVALDGVGRPVFAATGAKRSRHCVTCFDLLWDGMDLRALPLTERRARLAEALAGCSPAFHLVEQFEDPLALLRAAEEHRLEGIVSKRLDRPYRSGTRCGWVKVKTSAWLAANSDRWKRFQRA